MKKLFFLLMLFFLKCNSFKTISFDGEIVSIEVYKNIGTYSRYECPKPHIVFGVLLRNNTTDTIAVYKPFFKDICFEQIPDSFIHFITSKDSLYPLVALQKPTMVNFADSPKIFKITPFTIDTLFLKWQNEDMNFLSLRKIETYFKKITQDSFAIEIAYSMKNKFLRKKFFLKKDIKMNFFIFNKQRKSVKKGDYFFDYEQIISPPILSD